MPLFVPAIERGVLDTATTLLTQPAAEPQPGGKFASGNVNCAQVAPYDGLTVAADSPPADTDCATDGDVEFPNLPTSK